MSATDLQRYIRIQNLNEWCTSIKKVLSHSAERGSIMLAWGEYAVHQEVVRNGIHFSLPGSEDVMQWSITAEPKAKGGMVTVHCTVNKTELGSDDQAQLQKFVEDWKTGLENGWARIKAELAKKPKVECAPWYG
ncbi:MAG: indole-3-glycerol phosphate synthase [Halobacteria archaeon]|nr:indole-3-glycerol phosphate synthase [Halobacteria archaeon]